MYMRAEINGFEILNKSLGCVVRNLIMMEYKCCLIDESEEKVFIV